MPTLCVHETMGPGWARDGALTNMVRILLADDHAVVRRGLRALFEAHEGFEVCAETNHGGAAVELAIHHKPDVAVLDISLPVVNEIEATRQIRKEASGTEVMIFTSRDTESEIRRGAACRRAQLHPEVGNR